MRMSFPQVGHKRAANEAAGIADDNLFVSQIHPVLHSKFAPAIQALPPRNSEELVRSELVRNVQGPHVRVHSAGTRRCGGAFRPTY